MKESLKGSNEDFNLMLEFLRDPAKAGAVLQLQEWFVVCMELKKQGILAPYAPVISQIAPNTIVRKIRDWRKGHDLKMRNRMSLLKEFALSAAKNNLHFLVVKGMGLSEVAYNDPFARQSGDIDLLVNIDDIPKADWILRELGWLQPGEARLVRPAHGAGTLTMQMLSDLQAPYTLRSNVILPHFTNYYRENGGVFETIEVHDRFSGLTSDEASCLLWAHDLTEMSDLPALTPGRSTALLLSCLTLYEDSEIVRVNTTERGTMGFKICVDIHELLNKMNNDELSESRSIAKELGIWDKVAAALNNVLEVFPDDEIIADKIAENRPLNKWSLPYIERVKSSFERASSGIRDLAKELKTCSLKSNVDASWTRLSDFSGRVMTDFEGRVLRNNASSVIEWKIPKNLHLCLDKLVFQAVLLGDYADDAIGIRANIFKDEDRWTGTTQRVGPNTVDGHASKAIREDPVKVHYEEDDDGLIVAFEPEMNCQISFLSVWHCLYGQLHRRIAGADFANAMESIMN